MASPSRGIPLPGFGAPAVGFDTPFEMLEACHERVQRTLALQQRLCEHLQTKGCDASARSAARDVLRYFDIAAPLHHEDEERHVFPALHAVQDEALLVAVTRLQAEHVAMAQRWTLARSALLALAGGSITQFSAEQLAALDAFAAGYAEHIRTEEEWVYPAARGHGCRRAAGHGTRHAAAARCHAIIAICFVAYLACAISARGLIYL
ncbi:MAG: hemerythrin domain-containing protein [Giesbergeria sp.]